MTNGPSPRPRRKQVRHYDEPGHVHELTFSCYQRQPLLTDDICRRLFCAALDRACERHHFRLFAFVLMPEHVHLLVQPSLLDACVSGLLFAIKRPFAYRVKQHLVRTNPQLAEQLTIRQRPGIETFRYWQEGSGYDRNLTEPATILAAIDYLHLNPVRRGLCAAAEDWRWSSARSFLRPSSATDPDLPRLTPLPPDLLG